MIRWRKTRRSAPLPTGDDAPHADTIVAIIKRDDVTVGHLRLVFDTMLFEQGTHSRPPGLPVVHWAIVWTDEEASRQGYPIVDGTELDAAIIHRELQAGHFTLRAVNYDVELLDEPNRTGVLGTIFLGWD